MFGQPNNARPPRLVERLSRDKVRIRQELTSNDYLDGTAKQFENLSQLSSAYGDSMLQNLEEETLQYMFTNWQAVIEGRIAANAEAHYFAAHLFDSIPREGFENIESTKTVTAADTSSMMERLRAALRAEFLEQFQFDKEKKQLAARVSGVELQFDSSINLRSFVSVMWNPLVQAGFFNEDGSRVSGKRKQTVAKATNVLHLLTSGLTRSVPTSGNDLGDYLTDLFSSIDNRQTDRVSWGDFVLYLIERVYHHSLQGNTKSLRMDSRAVTTAANGSLIYQDSFIPSFPLHAQHWIQRVFYFGQGGWDSVVALEGNHAVVCPVELFDCQNLRIHDGDQYAAEYDDHNNAGVVDADDEYNGKHEALVERLRVSGASHIENGVHYFGHRGAVNACEWISKEKVFLTVATELTQLRFWSVHNRTEFRFLNHLKLPVPDDSSITSVRIDEKRLLSADTIKIAFGTRSGYVLTGDIVDADAVKRARQIEVTAFRPHTDAVTDMLVLPRSQRIVTCGLDGQILSFLPGEPERSIAHYQGHDRGVLSMTYCAGYELFVSAGFEYIAYCWAENLPRSPAFKLEDLVQPHQHPICSVMSVPKSPTVYTMDTAGIVKVFDIRTLKVLGSWGALDVGRVPAHVANEIQLGQPATESSAGGTRVIASAAYTGNKHRCILVSGRGVHRYYTESRNGDADRPLDSSDPIVALHVGQTSFLTAAATVVRLWSQETGRIIHTHKTFRYSASNVTVAVVDDVGAKIITGHADGQVIAFQKESGVLLRRYRYHDGRILFLSVDFLHGVIISSCSAGQLAFWRDRDSATSFKGRYAHCRLGLKPVEAAYHRDWGALPSDIGAVVAAPFDSDTIRTMTFHRWIVNRWSSYARNKKMQKAGSVIADDSIRPIRTPCALMNLLYPGVAKSDDHHSARIAVLCSKTVCRVFDYSVMPPAATHRLFLGRDRPLLAVALMRGQRTAVVSDAHGLMFVWLLPQGKPAILMSTYRNRCLVSSYNNPHEEFRQEEDDYDAAAATHVGSKEGKEDAEMVHLSSTMPPYKAPPDAVPSVTCVWLDVVRHALYTGDDVGFVSIWEVEPVFRGFCEAFEALHESESSGMPPRWVYAWRAHPLPVVHVQTMDHDAYAVITLGADNMVSLWTISGDWLAGLRQGPVVDRTWLYPYPLLSQTALVRYRFEKLHQAFQTKELQRLRRVRDGEEFDLPAVHPELRVVLVGDQRRASKAVDVAALITRRFEPSPDLERHPQFLKKKLVVPFSSPLGGPRRSSHTLGLSPASSSVPSNATSAIASPTSSKPLDEAVASACQPAPLPFAANDLPVVPDVMEPLDDEEHSMDASFGQVVEEITTLEKRLWQQARGKIRPLQPPERGSDVKELLAKHDVTAFGHSAGKPQRGDGVQHWGVLSRAGSSSSGRSCGTSSMAGGLLVAPGSAAAFNGGVALGSPPPTATKKSERFSDTLKSTAPVVVKDLREYSHPQRLHSAAAAVSRKPLPSLTSERPPSRSAVRGEVSCGGAMNAKVDVVMHVLPPRRTVSTPPTRDPLESSQPELNLQQLRWSSRVMVPSKGEVTEMPTAHLAPVNLLRPPSSLQAITKDRFMSAARHSAHNS